MFPIDNLAFLWYISTLGGFGGPERTVMFV